MRCSLKKEAKSGWLSLVYSGKEVELGTGCLRLRLAHNATMSHQNVTGKSCIPYAFNDRSGLLCDAISISQMAQQ